MCNNLKAKLAVKYQGRRVVLLYGKDEHAALSECLFEQYASEAAAPSVLSYPKPRDVHETVIAAHQYVAEKLAFFFNHPPHTAMQLVLEHALSHRVRKECFLEVQ